MAAINKISDKASKYRHGSLKYIALVILRFYQVILSPILQIISLSTIGGCCRFYPSCSDYCKQTIKLYGFGFKSIKLSLLRILRCRPNYLYYLSRKKYKTSGYDPVE